jgi:hypothetical protein
LLVIISEDDEFIFNLSADMLPRLMRSAVQRRVIAHSIEDRELLRIVIALLGGTKNPQGALTFCSYYQSSGIEFKTASDQLNQPEAKAIAVLRTVINLDGDVIQTLRKDILPGETALQIAIVHNYLVGQIMRQFNDAIATYLRSQLQPWLGFAFGFVSILAYAPMAYLVWLLAIANQSPANLDAYQRWEYLLARSEISTAPIAQFSTAALLALLPPLLVILHRPVFRFLGKLMLSQLALGRGLLRDLAIHAFGRFF